MEGRYRAYPEYKESGVEWLGNVPTQWKLAEIKRFAQVQGGYAFDSSLFLDDGEPVIRIGDINQDGHISLNNCKCVSSTIAKKFQQFTVNTGELVMAMTGATIGKAGWYKNADPALVNQRVGIFKCDEKNLVYRYLWFLLSSSGYQEYIQLTAFGGAQPNISDTGMVAYRTAIPNIPDQTQIANFLDHETAKIDTLIEKQQQLITLLQEKRQAVISHAVTRGLNPDAPMKDSGVEWLGEVPEHWVVSRYKFCTSRVVVGIAEAATHAYADNGVPLIRSTNIHEEGLNTSDLLYLKKHFADLNTSKYLYSNDIVTVRTGYPGISTVIPETLPQSQCFTNLITTPTNKFNSYFLSEYLNSHTGKSYFKLLGWGSAQKNISVPILQNIPIAYPEIEEQNKIVFHVLEQRNRFSNLIGKMKKQVDLLQERRTALISAAVTGKIDVRDWKPTSSPSSTSEALQ